MDRHPRRRSSTPRQRWMRLTRIRGLLAVAVLLLFALVCLAVLRAPEASVIGQVLPMIAGMLVIVVSYYFPRKRDE